VKLPDHRAVRNHLDSLHAIALANIGELTTGLAVHSTLPATGRGILKHLGVDYRKKARGTVVATCRVDVPAGAGRHQVQAVAQLRNTAGEIVAEVTGTWVVDR
jgi:acyl-coenzyme A thioesterase PaaI-like protein